MGRRLIASAVFPEGPVERQRRYSRTLRDSISQDAWIAASEAYVALDQLSVFEQVRVPTLFIAQATRETDRQHAVRLAAAVDDARLVLTDNRPDRRGSCCSPCMPRIHGHRDRAGNDHTRGDTAVILFADIVDSTAHTERMGDAPFRSQSREVDERLRAIIRAHGWRRRGREGNR